jgi:hypothetical protein
MGNRATGPIVTKEYRSSWIFEPCLTCANAIRRVQHPGFSLGNCGLHGALRPAKTTVSTALGCRFMVRMGPVVESAEAPASLKGECLDQQPWARQRRLGDDEVPASARPPTALSGACSVALSAKPRPGALLSLDDFGSSVERAGYGQVLWRVQIRAAERLLGPAWR